MPCSSWALVPPVWGRNLPAGLLSSPTPGKPSLPSAGLTLQTPRKPPKCQHGRTQAPWPVLATGDTRLETPAPGLFWGSSQEGPWTPAARSPSPTGFNFKVAGDSPLRPALPRRPSRALPGGDDGGGRAPTLVLSLVVVAGLVGDAVLVGIPPHRQVVAPLAGARVAAVDDVLHGQQGGGPGPLPLDVDPVCEGSTRTWSAPAPRGLRTPGPPAPALPGTEVSVHTTGHPVPHGQGQVRLPAPRKGLLKGRWAHRSPRQECGTGQSCPLRRRPHSSPGAPSPPWCHRTDLHSSDQPHAFRNPPSICARCPFLRAPWPLLGPESCPWGHPCAAPGPPRPRRLQAAAATSPADDCTYFPGPVSHRAQLQTPSTPPDTQQGLTKYQPRK